VLRAHSERRFASVAHPGEVLVGDQVSQQQQVDRITIAVMLGAIGKHFRQAVEFCAM